MQRKLLKLMSYRHLLPIPTHKKLTFILITLTLLTACQTKQVGIPNDATEAEIQMAEIMGITVEEFRNQTPEQHMKTMQKVMDMEKEGMAAPGDSPK